MKPTQENKTILRHLSSLFPILRMAVLLCSCLMLASSTPAFASTRFSSAHPTQEHLWTCNIQSSGGKIEEKGIWGSGYVQCSEPMSAIDIQLVALYCQPVLWGCFWFEQGPMGAGCSYAKTMTQADYWCPEAALSLNKVDEWYSPAIAPGTLYGVRMKVIASALDGTSMADAVDSQVQF